MEKIKLIFDSYNYLSTIIVLFSLIVTLILWIRGIFPVLWRLGNGLSRRKISVFAKGDAFSGIESLFHDSKLFNKTNIFRVSSIDDFGRAEKSSVFIVFYPDWKEEEICEILKRKRDGTALIVYAPQEFGFIPKEMMEKLNKERNVLVNNFRGRLLNDIVVSMITTSYEKK